MSQACQNTSLGQRGVGAPNVELQRDKSQQAWLRSTSGRAPSVALLTGGHDRPYVWRLAAALTSKGILVDLIGSNALIMPQLLSNPLVRFLNLRGDQCRNVSVRRKIE